MAGNVVFDSDYFHRKYDEKRLIKKIKRGQHIMLLAPRRSGKTCMLRALENDPPEGYVFLYSMIQSCTSEAGFYLELITTIYDSDFIGNLSKFKKGAKQAVATAFGYIDKIDVGGQGITLKDQDDPLNEKDLIQAIRNLELDKKLIIVLDEFPDLIQSISEKQDLLAVSNFLKRIRTISQDKEINTLIQFVFTGSIGLDTLAHKLGVSNLLNTTDKEVVEPLTELEAHDFMLFLNKKNDAEMHLTKSTRKQILARVEWYMPYYLELLWERLEDFCDRNDIATPEPEHVDAAYEKLFETHYKSNFIHWAERLDRFEKQERKFAKAALAFIAQHGQATYAQLYDLSLVPDLKGVDHAFVIDSLEHDGYFFETHNEQFSFTSPILKDWWHRYAKRSL